MKLWYMIKILKCEKKYCKKKKYKDIHKQKKSSNLIDDKRIY